MRGVERVTGAGEVDVAPPVAVEPVVGGVVDPAEGKGRPAVIAFGGVVVDDVEDHLDPGAMKRLDHPLELAHLLALVARRGIAGVGGQVADRGIPPVVPEAAAVQELLRDRVMDGQQLDGADAEVRQVPDGGVGGESGVGAAQVLANAGMACGEALDVNLVDRRLVPRRPEQAVALPVEARVDDDALRDRRRIVLFVPGVAVLVARWIAENPGALPVDPLLDRTCIRVDQQLGRVEAVPLLGCIGPVDAVAVALAGADTG